MKKILVTSLLVVLTVVFSFADVLSFVPDNSKATILIKNAQKTYEQLKTVPTVKSLLSEPMNMELILTSTIDMILTSAKVKSADFYKSYAGADIAIYVQEPKNNDYAYGVVIGPIANQKVFNSAFIGIMDSFKEQGLSLKLIYNKENGKDFAIIVSDSKVYASSKLGNSMKNVKELGIFVDVATSELTTNGQIVVKDNLLVADMSGIIDDKDINKDFVKNPANVPFMGTLFAMSGFIPNNVGGMVSTVNGVDEKSIEELLKSTKGIEINEEINFSMDNVVSSKNGDMATGKGYAKFDTKLSITDIMNILVKNKMTVKKADNNTLNVTVTKVGDKKLDKPSKFNVWDNESMYISEDTKANIDALLKKKPTLGSNSLYKLLSSKAGIGNLAVFFVDLTKIFNDNNAKGQFGAYASVNYTGNKKIDINFILK